MTEHFVTLFDHVFLAQGLALYQSLLEHGGDFVLWVLCLDSECLQVLRKLNLPRIRLLNLAILETPALLAVKAGRTQAEYCWTLTPWSIQWVFESDPRVQRVTYLDADLFFLKSPTPIFDEFAASGRAVLITEHGYAPEYDQTPTSGRYCVQFLPVVRGAGEPVLYWWRERCLEWCFARNEDSLFGDQKYLERFSEIFPGLVYDIGSDCRFQGPWNASVCPFSVAIAFHFHGLRVLSTQFISLSTYPLPTPHLFYVYLPYCRLLRMLASQCDIDVISQGASPSFLSLFIRKVKRIAYKVLLDQSLSPRWCISRGLNSDMSFL